MSTALLQNGFSAIFAYGSLRMGFAMGVPGGARGAGRASQAEIIDVSPRRAFRPPPAAKTDPVIERRPLIAQTAAALEPPRRAPQVYAPSQAAMGSAGLVPERVLRGQMIDLEA